MAGYSPKIVDIKPVKLPQSHGELKEFPTLYGEDWDPCFIPTGFFRGFRDFY